MQQRYREEARQARRVAWFYAALPIAFLAAIALVAVAGLVLALVYILLLAGVGAGGGAD